MYTDRKLAFCMEQELQDTKMELKLCKQHRANLRAWLEHESLAHPNYTAYKAYQQTLHYLEEQHANHTSNVQ